MLEEHTISFDTALAQIQDGLHRLYHVVGLNNMSGMALYRLVYNLCNAAPNSYAEPLFSSIAIFLDQHVDKLYQDMVVAHDILSMYASAWKRYSLASQSVNVICAYMNRVLLDTRMSDGRALGEKSSRWRCKYRRQSVLNLAYTIWRERLVMRIRRELDDRLVGQLLGALENDRDGVWHQSSEILQQVIRSLVDLGSETKEPLIVYQKLFEAAWIFRTRSYYEREAKHTVATLTLSDFIRKVYKRLEEESERCQRYLDPSSHDKILHPMITEYIVQNADMIYADFRSMLVKEQQQDCFIVYTLLLRVKDGVLPLQTTFETFITEECRQRLITLDWSSPKIISDYVNHLIDLYQHYAAMCDKFFANDPGFIAAFDKAFHSILNDRVKIRQPEILARHCDQLLRRKTRETDQVLEERLVIMIKLFGYLDDKDIFQKFYSRAMAKRLIADASISEELEMMVIAQLRKLCGVDFVGKLHRMLTDIELNRDLNTSWQQWPTNNTHKDTLDKPTDLHPLILTTGAWPLSNTSQSQLILPTMLEQFTGRKLTWFWHLSKADIRVHYLKRRYELSATLYQLAILLCFNHKSECLLSEIRRQTGLLAGDLIRTARSLVDCGILTSNTKLDTDPSEALLSLNLQFESKRTKIKISTPLQVESAQEQTTTVKAIEDDRRLFLQAVLVRIMKSRRELSHLDLISETIQLATARFNPEVGMIKRCIEQLIDKQFIERDLKDRDLYRYVA
ncbi:Cullin [Syncephalis fuscata]|nr:Cullin [Syncephalis fuscata]